MTDPETIYTLLKEIYLIIDDGDRHLLNRFGLTVPRFYVLFHLGNEAGMSLRQLSEQMLCDKSNITRIIKGMMADGLVERQRHESDGRRFRLFLSDKGGSLREAAMRLHQEYNVTRFATMTAKTVDDQDLYQMLIIIKEDLTNTLPQAATI